MLERLNRQPGTVIHRPASLFQQGDALQGIP
jgi:hypothetical protein